MSTRTGIFATGENVTANDLNSLAGAWNSYTPQIDQGATTNIAKTVTYAKYLQFGKLVICNLLLDVSGAGTAGAGITVTLPVTAAAASQLIVGTGQVLDSSSARYEGAALLASTTQVNIWPHGLAWSIGNTPSFALAAGDRIGLHVIYEAA